MAPAVKFFSAVLLVCIFVTGNGQRCELSALLVQQTNTGLKVGYDTIFEVDVKNMCRCKLVNAFLTSQGFSSSMPVDPKLFRFENGSYLVNDGNSIPHSNSIQFRYSWDHYFKMTPASFQIACW